MVLLVLLGTQVISAFGARATPEYSLISAFGTPGTRRGTRECSVFPAFGNSWDSRALRISSFFGTCGSREYQVISAVDMGGTREHLQ